jgi:hypothetical protein
MLLSLELTSRHAGLPTFTTKLRLRGYHQKDVVWMAILGPNMW